jgi:hypothetical protein
MILLIIALILFLILLQINKKKTEYFSFNCPPCPTLKCPDCPECPTLECPNPDVALEKRNDHLTDMVKYLTLIVRKNYARDELYKWNQAAHQVWNSPKIQTIEKQIRFMIEKIKSDPDKLKFFRENLDQVITK